ncbi:MAG: hypothetical protein FH751_02795 [Firmicutes bacterium]|nr:hypothetical protein [Bacillota bacterium]
MSNLYNTDHNTNFKHTNNYKYESSYRKNDIKRDNYHNDEDYAVGIGMWLVILACMTIPVLNIVLIIFLAVAPPNKTLGNFGKASLILFGIVFFLTLLLNA